MGSSLLLFSVSGEGISECIDAVFRGGIVEYLKVLLHQVAEKQIADKDSVDLVRLVRKII